MEADALALMLEKAEGRPVSLDVVQATLKGLHEIENHDGRLIALASHDEHGVWKASQI